MKKFLRYVGLFFILPFLHGCLFTEMNCSQNHVDEFPTSITDCYWYKGKVVIGYLKDTKKKWAKISINDLENYQKTKNKYPFKVYDSELPQRIIKHGVKGEVMPNQYVSYILKVPWKENDSKFCSLNDILGKDPSKTPMIILGFPFALLGDIFITPFIYLFFTIFPPMLDH